jgi:hypothetical protein
MNPHDKQKKKLTVDDTVASIDIENLTVGQIVWECQRGLNVKLVIIEAAKRTEPPGDVTDDQNNHPAPGWLAKANFDGKEVILFTSDEAPAYGPRLYAGPIYSWVNVPTV